MKIPFKALDFEESVNVYLGILRENTRVPEKLMRERRGRTRDEEIEGGGNGFLVSCCFWGCRKSQVAAAVMKRESECEAR